MPNWLATRPQFLPPGNYELDHGQPLARGLELALFGSHLPGGTRWVDLSRNRAHGTSVSATWQTERGGAATRFNGTNSYVSVPAPVGSRLNALSTPTAFIVARPAAVDGMILSRLNYSGTGGRDFQVYVYDSTSIRFTINGGINSIFRTIALNQRYSIGLSYSGAIVQTYINGLPGTVGSVTGTALSTGNPWLIGADDDDPSPSLGNWLNGTVEMVLLFSRVLSPAEILSLHRNPYQLLRLEPRWWPEVTAAGTSGSIFHSTIFESRVFGGGVL